MPNKNSGIPSDSRWVEFARLVRQAQAIDRTLTQSEIAKRVGVDQSSVSGWVRGTKHPKYEHVEALARVLEPFYPQLNTDFMKILAFFRYTCIGYVDEADDLNTVSDRELLLSLLDRINEQRKDIQKILGILQQ